MIVSFATFTTYLGFSNKVVKLLNMSLGKTFLNGLIVVVSLGLISCGLSAEGPPPQDYSNYYPMHVGDTLVYHKPSLDFTHPEDTISVTACVGKFFIKWRAYFGYVTPVRISETKIRLDTEFYRKNFYGDVYLYDQFADSEYLFYDFHTYPVDYNRYFEWKFYLTDTNSIETIPWGTFKNCKTLYHRGQESFYTEIFAPGIGCINRPWRTDNFLLRAVINGISYP